MTTNRIKVSRADKGIKAILIAAHPTWTGRKVHVQPATEYKMANYWDGGSRDYVMAYELATGRVYGPAIHTENPINGAAHATVRIPEGVLIVEHSVFCGKDAGVTIYAHPANMPRLLPTDEAALTDKERAIIAVINCGKDQGMAFSHFGGEERTTVRAMARRGLVKVVGTDGVWIHATI